MSSSKVLADRMMLDLRAIILSLEYSINALQSHNPGIVQQGKSVLEAAKKDVESVQSDHIMADSLDIYYSFSVDKQNPTFRQIIEKIESGSYAEAHKILADLTKNTRYNQKVWK